MPTVSRRRNVAPLPSLLLSVTLVAARAGAQSGSACSNSQLRVEGALAARWLTPVVELCESLSSMRDVDPSAQLRLVAAGEDVIVQATLGDGRSTLRRVHTTSELGLTVEALITVPPPQPPPESPPEHPPPAPAPAAPPARPSALTVASPLAARHLTLETGALAVFRVAGTSPYLSVGLTGYGGVRSGPWLLALGVRYDGYQTALDDRPRDFEMVTAGGGFMLWRQLAMVDTGVLEAGLLAWLLGESQAYTPERVELTYGSFDVRLATAMRWMFGAKPLREFVSLDAELSPSRVRHSLHLNEALPPLPGWSVGLGVGVAWEPR